MPMKILFVLAFDRELSRPHRARLKGIKPDEIVDIDLLKGKQREDAFRAVNPQMLIPALIEDGGPVLFQSMAIMEYLEETHPQPPLLPRDPLGRARVRGLCQICRVRRASDVGAARAQLPDAGAEARPTTDDRLGAALAERGAARARDASVARQGRPASIATATRSRSPTSASPARWSARASSTST